VNFIWDLLKDKEKLLKILVYFVFFLSLIFPYSDFDWGWHLQYGEYFLQTGKILSYDIFSWTLPSYQWINHSWAYDPILYLIYNNLGFIGLSLAGAIISFLSFFLIVRLYKLSSWKIGILAFFFARITQTGIGAGLRSQVVALLLFSLLMVLIKKSENNIKWLFLMPPLFLLWANFHGTFFLGLIIVAVFLSFRFFTQKPRQFLIPMIFTSSIIFTLVNPFFYRIYIEALKHFNSPYLNNVSEWMPPTFNCPSCHFGILIFYTVIIFILFLKRRKRIDVPFILVSIGVVFLAFTHKRYEPILIIVTLPFLANVLSGIKIKLHEYKIYPYVFFLTLIVLIEFNFFNRFTSPNLFTFNQEAYCKYSGVCSIVLFDYLKHNSPIGRGFNFYDMGGSLIGANFPAKLFIDGRMHLWEKNGHSPFADYVKIYYEQDYELFKKYNFNWALIQINSNLAKTFISSNSLGKWVLIGEDNNLGYFVKEK
jgi:hypothetical protein